MRRRALRLVSIRRGERDGLEHQDNRSVSYWIDVADDLRSK